jgi:ubiquinone/menaquinone biosynthesis C-methylase UbiE
MLTKLEKFTKMGREQGYLCALRFILSRLFVSIRLRMRGFPNTIDANLEIWSSHDWSKDGEEWSNTSEWKASVVEHVLEPNVPIGSRVLEIGPGAGRWTEYLLHRAKHVIVVDLTPMCIEMCKKRFKDFENIDYFINDGRDLSFIPANSIDRIWSWDVFVHIQSTDVENYVRQFAAILVPGGRGVIHHSKNGVSQIGWRSDMTAQKMVDFCKRHGLDVLQQFDSWDNGRVRIWPEIPEDAGPDIVTIFAKPM